MVTAKVQGPIAHPSYRRFMSHWVKAQKINP